MLEFLRGKVSDRKFRLFALACCRRIRGQITDDRSRDAIAFVERHAEVGLARRRGRPAVERASLAVCQEVNVKMSQTPDPVARATCLVTANASHAARATLMGDAYLAALWAADFAANAAAWGLLIASGSPSPADFDPTARVPEEGEQVRLLRDIAGDPFRPRAPVDPTLLSWNDGIAQKLARTIYEGHRFSDMPVLADALEEAGCQDQGILGHCRSGGEHVRGCWVVDLLLGKG
jgi:hypothetical protein